MSRPVLKQLAANQYNPASKENPDDEEEYSSVIESKLLTEQMRDATRSIHKLSDSLILAKLGLAASNNVVWAQGLLIFYEIFRALEESLERLKDKDPSIKKIEKTMKKLRRTNAFQKDIAHYLGSNYLQNYIVQPEVVEYLVHLQILEEREPLRLLAYFYHLYMGLLSGGQVLRRKKQLEEKLDFKFVSIFSWVGGFLYDILCFNCISLREVTTSSHIERYDDEVTSFVGTGLSVYQLKKEIRDTINKIAEDLSFDERSSIVQEGIVVFRRNNEVVRSIQNTTKTALKNVMTNPVVVLAFFFFLWCLYLVFSFMRSS